VKLTEEPEPQLEEQQEVKPTEQTATLKVKANDEEEER
jgi:hypothetical protein